MKTSITLQAAETAGVETLLSENLAAGQRYAAFRVENPFAGPDEQLRPG